MHSATAISPRALREREAARYTGLSVHTFRNTRCADMRRRARGEPIAGPRWTNLGRSVVYLIEDLDAWLEAARASAMAEEARS